MALNLTALGAVKMEHLCYGKVWPGLWQHCSQPILQKLEVETHEICSDVTVGFS